MALQHKRTVKTEGYIPIPLKLSGRGKSAVVAFPEPIKWATLSEDDYWKQWAEFLNCMHNYQLTRTVDRDDLFPHFVRYLKAKKYTQEQIVTLQRADDNVLTFSIVSKAYLLMTTNIDNPQVAHTDKWLTKKIKAILQRASVAEKTVPEVTKRNIVDYKRDKRSELLGELQGLEDEFGEVSILEFLRERNVAKEHLNRIEEMFQPRLDELRQVLTTKDEQLKEAYACYRKPEIKKMIEWYQRLLDDVILYRQTKDFDRKPRVVKPVTPEKQTRNFKYMKAHSELNIKSADPKKVIGATTAWLYNTKSRQMIVYNASAQEKQLTIQGTSIHGWDPKTSYCKKLRWPEEQLGEFMKTIGKIAQRTFIETIKAKPGIVRGRVNPDMLLLKVT